MGTPKGPVETSEASTVSGSSPDPTMDQAGALLAKTSSILGAKAVTAARRYLGTPYVWGGGGVDGPTDGGFDCSGLAQYAVARATGGRLILPRTTYDQIGCGHDVDLKSLRQGDLVFSNFSAPGVPEHVAIYVGRGRVIEAPRRGMPVRINELPSEAEARRVL